MAETLALDAIRSGGKRALAAALARLEATPDATDTADLLDQAYDAPKGICLGLTGPPGVGKSTLVDALIRAWRGADRTIAVIAVDPSSARSGGALLGDRTRLTTDPGDQGTFVRSMAARDRLGGIADQTFPAMVLMRALFDLVIVETVGVGQSETAITDIADLTAFCAQPGSGDALQYMKAGIMEVPDLVIVTKADMGQIAQRTLADLKGALSLGNSQTEIPVIACSATSHDGIAEVVHAIETTSAQLSPRFVRTRAAQVKTWSDTRISTRFGTYGLEIAEALPVDNGDNHRFRGITDVKKRLYDAMNAAFR